MKNNKKENSIYNFVYENSQLCTWSKGGFYVYKIKQNYSERKKSSLGL